MPITTPRAALAALRALGKPREARVLTKFFQAEPGGYAAGDRFLGVRVPQIRAVLRGCELTLPACVELLASKFHEARLLALLAMVRLAGRSEDATRRRICAAYLRNTSQIDNWDLVDSSAEHIVGSVLRGPDLAKLASSKSVWERRIAMMATHHSIKRGAPTDALRIARVLKRDPHDLIHKAVGWMLREVGKRCDRALLRDFLTAHAATLPRTTLRYAIEHFDAAERRKWMAAGKSKA